MVIAQLTNAGRLMLDDHVRELYMTIQTNLDGLTDDEIKKLVMAASTISELSQKTSIKYVLPKPTKD